MPALAGAQMSYTIEHVITDQRPGLSVRKRDGNATVSLSLSGRLPLLTPGRLERNTYAKFSATTRTRELPIDGEPHPLHGGWVTSTVNHEIPLTFELLTPDGTPHTRDEITLNDMARFRDLRGTTVGEWSWRVSGSNAIPLLGGDTPTRTDDTKINEGPTLVSIKLIETLASQSPWPFVDAPVQGQGAERHSFDLYRVGDFVATARSRGILASVGGRTIRRGLRLRDPDGTIVAESDNGELRYPVTLPVLERSRGADGGTRLWELEVLPGDFGGQLNRPRVWASVIERARLRLSPLQSRIDELLGAQGDKIAVWGDHRGDQMRCRMRIDDVFTAETLDSKHLLDKRLLALEAVQDAGFVRNDITPGFTYTLAEADRVLHTFENDTLGISIPIRVDVTGLRVASIEIKAGASQHIQPSVPALAVTLKIAGEVKVKAGSVTIGSAKVRGGVVSAEAGVRLSGGNFEFLHWIDDDPLDIDLSTAALVTAGLLNPLLGLSLLGISELVEERINDLVDTGLGKVLDGGLAALPGILTLLLGAPFTYRSLKVDGDAFVLEYLAPEEPVRRPGTRQYHGIVGRSYTQLGPDAWQFRPRTLDTWKADNLQNIDHVVMVMMENRSFDHVLGHCAAEGQESDGLTPDLVAFLNAQDVNGVATVGKLRDTNMPANQHNFKTAFPIGVGHGLADVTMQLRDRIDFNGRTINAPSGFLENFIDRHRMHEELLGESGIEPKDVLGYHDTQDLPFFKHLLDNYAYCERFFCSHPGPTLPNRMLSLTGDVQYDRNGEPILDNNHGDNFVLSRDHTIFDLLKRKGVDWRVYESYPSVTMLRMFARYATNTTDIVRMNRFATDVANNDLPAFTVVDPQMHAFPQNDDHPVADMYRGQTFLKGVYDTLRSNPDVWKKTLLIITYDEHGGFYDHVVPPLAEALTREMVLHDGGEGHSLGPTTPGTHFIPYGVRVPTFVVSPWVQPGKGPDKVLDHCSILKTVIARFLGDQKPFLSDRVAAAQSFESYLTAPAARMDVPASPDMPLLPDEIVFRRGRMIATEPMSRKAMRAGNVDYHDLSGMVARMLGRDTANPIA